MKGERRKEYRQRSVGRECTPALRQTEECREGVYAHPETDRGV